ncbi:hypothetical protein NIF40_08710 [[Clostridium] leptum]|nr:hypothetical protein [[Clostridium] leptum]
MQEYFMAAFVERTSWISVKMYGRPGNICRHLHPKGKTDLFVQRNWKKNCKKWMNGVK